MNFCVNISSKVCHWINIRYINIYIHYRSNEVGHIGQRKKNRPERFTKLQYAVLEAQKQKLQEQTKYYMLMNEKLRRELDIPSEK